MTENPGETLRFPPGFHLVTAFFALEMPCGGHTSPRVRIPPSPLHCVGLPQGVKSTRLTPASLIGTVRLGQDWANPSSLLRLHRPVTDLHTSAFRPGSLLQLTSGYL